MKEKLKLKRSNKCKRGKSKAKKGALGVNVGISSDGGNIFFKGG
jgi:hypothetical protein